MRTFATLIVVALLAGPRAGRLGRSGLGCERCGGGSGGPIALA